jgi:hypothetical protein
MSHPLLVAAFTIGVSASAAWAKDLCIEVTAGPDAGSQLFLRNVKLGKLKFGPTHGYFGRFDAATDQITRFFPVNGQAMVSSVGNVAAGVTWHDAGLDFNPLFFTVGDGLFGINFVCTPGADGQIGPLDTCTMRIENGTSGSDNGQVIACSDVAKIP